VVLRRRNSLDGHIGYVRVEKRRRIAATALISRCVAGIGIPGFGRLRWGDGEEESGCDGCRTGERARAQRRTGSTGWSLREQHFSFDVLSSIEVCGCGGEVCPPPHPSCYPQLAAGYCALMAAPPATRAETVPAGMSPARVENACETDLPAATATFSLVPCAVVTETVADSLLRLLTFVTSVSLPATQRVVAEIDSSSLACSSAAKAQLSTCIRR